MTVRRTGSALFGLLMVLGLWSCGPAVYHRGGRRVHVAERDAPPVDIGITFFYRRLAVHGDWFRHGRYGWVWRPARVPFGWRPYTFGYWAFTNDGWLWVSHWEWGWAPFHHGRWFFEPGWGWVWRPGTVWAPAWVAWRWGDGYAGWAPLPPDVEWDVAVRFRGFDAGALPTSAWVFVGAADFPSDRLASRIIPVHRNVTLVERTRHVTDVASIEGRPVDRSVRREWVEEVSGRRLSPLPVRRVPTPAATTIERPEDGNEVRVYRPRISPDRRDISPPHPDDVEQRHRTEREILRERHQTLRSEFETRYRSRVVPPDRVEAERRELLRQIERETKTLEERQARERRPTPRRKTN